MTDRQHARLRLWVASGVEIGVTSAIFFVMQDWKSRVAAIVAVSAIVWAESVITAARAELRR